MGNSVNIRRVALVAAIAVLLAVAIAWQQGVFQLLRRPDAGNSLLVIVPYRFAGTWVFDDPAVGLRQEPFVAGIPEMMDELVRDIPGADAGFRLTVSAWPFPGHTHQLNWVRGDGTGTWYYSEQYQKEGWLCPGLFKYYAKPPANLYVRADPIPPADRPSR